MSYRDELEAAHRRIADLEAKLEERREAPVERPPPAPLAKRPERGEVARRRIHLQRPWSYFPLWLILRRSIAEVVAWRPPRPESDGLLDWLWIHAIVTPVYFAFAVPLFFLVLVPAFVVLSVVCTPIAFVIVVLRSLKLTAEKPGPAPEPEYLDMPGVFWIVTLLASIGPLVLGLIAALLAHFA